ncbi:MAG: GumC family protein [Rubricoccaceae bacterium]
MNNPSATPPELPAFAPLGGPPLPPTARYAPEEEVEEAVYEDVGGPFARIFPSLGEVPFNDQASDREAGPGADRNAGGDGHARWADGNAAPFGSAPLGDGQGGELLYDEGKGFLIDYEHEDEEAETPADPLAAEPSPALPVLAAAPPPVPPAARPPALVAEPPPRAYTRRAVRERAQMLRRHWPTIALSTLLGLALFGAYSLLASKTYKAYSLLLINAPQNGSEFVRGLAVPGEGQSRVLNQALILQHAPEIAGRTAERLLARPDAAALPVVQRAAAEAPAGRPDVATLADLLQRKIVTVEPSGENVDAVRVEASSSEPREAALIATYYTEEYLALSRETTRAGVAGTRAVLEEQVAAREADLEDVEARLAAYMTRANAAGLDDQTRGAISQITTLQAQLDLARVETRTRQARLEALQRDAAAVQPRLATRAAATSDVEVRVVDEQIAEIERLLEQIYAQYPDLRVNPSHHPDTRALVDRLAALQADKRRLAEQQARDIVAAGGIDGASTGANGPAYVAALQREISQERAALEGARAQAVALEARLGQARGQLRQVPGQQIELDQLQRERQTVQDELTALTARLRDASFADDTDAGLARVIRPVQVPRRPASPNVPVNLAIGGLLGLLFGFALAVVRYRTDSRVYTPGDLEENGFVVVGTVPDLRAALRRPRQAIDGASVHPGLVTTTDPLGADAEAFRHLQAGLQAGGAHAPQVVLVTGPEVGTGKSLVAANLAVAAAQAGRRTLLMDADVRQPTVGALLGLGHTPPLGEGGEHMNVVYWSTIVPGLLALTPRETASRPDQLWTPEQITRLLANLRAAFDLIVIDAPAALVSADAALLAPGADAALLVAEAGRSDLDAMAQVATELVAVGLHQVGAVLNRFDTRRAVGYRRTVGYRQSSTRTPAAPVLP